MKCAGAAKRLSQGNRCAAVQNAERLMRTFIHWHACANEIIADFGEFNTDRAKQRVRGLIELIKIGSVLPDGGHSF